MSAYGVACPKPTRKAPKPRRRIRSVSTGTRAQQRALADRLCAALVKRLAGNRCERCGSKPTGLNPLDWAHGITRKNHQVRWAHSNTFALCRLCHDYFDRLFPGALLCWSAMKVSAGSRMNLMWRAAKTDHPDMDDVIAGLKVGRFTQGER